MYQRDKKDKEKRYSPYIEIGDMLHRQEHYVCSFVIIGLFIMFIMVYEFLI